MGEAQSDRKVGRAFSVIEGVEIEVKRRITRADGTQEPERVVGRSTGIVAYRDGCAHFIELDSGVLKIRFGWFKRQWQYFKIGLRGLWTGKVFE